MIRTKIISLVFIAIASAGFMAILYVTSEKQIHHENPFQRRFIKGSAELDKQFELHNQTLYFAGSDGSHIYMGDSRAPLQIFVIDTLLQTKRHFTIKLENEQFPFSHIQVKVAGPYFYLLDGTVPIVFKGLVTDWNAKIAMKEANAYFLNAEVLGSDALVFKNYLAHERETIIGKYDFSNGKLKTTHVNNLLQKQIDGLFDVDGILKVDALTKNFVYLYYYRNQFSVTDVNLNLLSRGNTIDTNKVANLKLSYDKNTGKKQLASPSSVVNRLFAVQGDFLFVNSNVPGKHENKEMWKTAGIVDVYDLNENTYLSSFYVHNIIDHKLRDMLLINNNLYVLVGKQINRYRLGKQFIRK